ncbi:DNA oxidative demethylase ALKBH2, partial [Cucurbita argyrosperma subsp. sororia]
MDRATPVRKPHTSTADLLTWPELPPADSPAFPSSASRSAPRSHQPSDGISKVVFGGQVTDEEVESLNKRKPCSGYKMKEMTGSGIFVGNEGEDEQESGSANPSQSKTGIRMYQQTLAGISHISFGEEGGVSPKKPTTLPEVAKQRELSGNLVSDADEKLKKQLSDAKYQELSGHDIFAPPPEILPRPTTARTLDLKGSIEIGEPDDRCVIPGEEPSVKTAKKIYDKKFSELSGNDIFKGDVPPSSTEKPLSVAKLREMSGSDIFADGKVEARDYLGGVRKPPGGESSIALV